MTDAPIEPGERDEGIAPVESEELVDGLPILAEVRPLEEPSAPALPAVQAAAAAMTGFVAGAATLAVMRRRQARRLARRVRTLDIPPVGAARTYLVHIQHLGRPEE